MDALVVALTPAFIIIIMAGLYSGTLSLAYPPSYSSVLYYLKYSSFCALTFLCVQLLYICQLRQTRVPCQKGKHRALHGEVVVGKGTRGNGDVGERTSP